MGHSATAVRSSSNDLRAKPTCAANSSDVRGDQAHTSRKEVRDVPASRSEGVADPVGHEHEGLARADRGANRRVECGGQHHGDGRRARRRDRRTRVLDGLLRLPATVAQHQSEVSPSAMISTGQPVRAQYQVDDGEQSGGGELVGDLPIRHRVSGPTPDADQLPSPVGDPRGELGQYCRPRDADEPVGSRVLRQQVGPAPDDDHRGLVGVASRRHAVRNREDDVAPVRGHAVAVLVLPHRAVIGVGEAANAGRAQLARCGAVPEQGDAVEDGVTPVPGPRIGPRPHFSCRTAGVTDRERGEVAGPLAASCGGSGRRLTLPPPAQAGHHEQEHDQDEQGAAQPGPRSPATSAGRRSAHESGSRPPHTRSRSSSGP